MTVRFLNNYLITVAQTYLDQSNKMSVQSKQIHVHAGDIYRITQFYRHPNGSLDLHFPKDSVLYGVATRIDSDICAINNDGTKKPSSGCGGCGKKKS
jgi:hypothetical protein